jgi:hypothetical protein
MCLRFVFLLITRVAAWLPLSDFPDEETGKAIPYGVYDVAANAGWVSVGTDGDTAAFAVESIRRWWRPAGRPGPATPARPGC